MTSWSPTPRPSDLLDPNGNLIQTYNCDPTVLPDCGGQFFAIALDPDGTSFWTADAFSGNIYRIDIATGQLLQTIQTGSAYLYGLSIENELNAATPPSRRPSRPHSPSSRSRATSPRPRRSRPS